MIEINVCKDCRFYSDNWCYERGIEVRKYSMSCELAKPNDKEEL